MAKGSRERLGFGLLLFTGQSGSDVHRMRWTDLVGGAIRVAQQKTKTKLTIPLHSDQRLCLPSHPASMRRLLRHHARSAAIREAGLLQCCKPHGLRKAAARRLAEAGCSASEIMAITGHKTLAEVERYTRPAEQEKLARQAIKRQSENKSGKLVREEVANEQNDIEIASIINRMALPTGIEPAFQG